jgi:predicted transcriptional regulator
MSKRLSVTATVRLDEEVIARVDTIAAERSTTWHKLTRAEVLRELINLGLAQSKRQMRSARPRGRRRASQGR